MGGHTSKACTFSEPAAVTPPPIPDLIVTGDGDPSPNGNYFTDGTFDGYVSYKREDSLYYIFYDNSNGTYSLSAEKGEVESVASWVFDDGGIGPVGNYRDYNYSMGSLIVSTL